MGNFFDALKAGARATADALGPGGYRVAGRAVRCAHCTGERFSLRSVPAHDVGSVLGLFGYALRCDACSHVMLFGDSPERV